MVEKVIWVPVVLGSEHPPVHVRMEHFPGESNVSVASRRVVVLAELFAARPDLSEKLRLGLFQILDFCLSILYLIYRLWCELYSLNCTALAQALEIVLKSKLILPYRSLYLSIANLDNFIIYSPLFH